MSGLIYEDYWVLSGEIFMGFSFESFGIWKCLSMWEKNVFWKITEGPWLVNFEFQFFMWEGKEIIDKDKDFETPSNNP